MLRHPLIGSSGRFPHAQKRWKGHCGCLRGPVKDRQSDADHSPLTFPLDPLSDDVTIALAPQGAPPCTVVRPSLTRPVIQIGLHVLQI